MDANTWNSLGIDLKLHLGVVDVPEPEGNTSYGVAMILEEKYSLFSKFAESQINDIAKNLTEGILGSLETLMQGNVPKDPFASATSQIDQDFRHFLDIEEMARLGVPGVPTKAALMGKSIRFKTKRGPRRPSFIDSGVLQTSLKSWVE
jgi:hypothetical protein